MQESGKSVVNASRDTWMDDLADALNNLSMEIYERTTPGYGVKDKELSDVLMNLDIIPAELGSETPISTVASWATLEGQEDVAEAL